MTTTVKVTAHCARETTKVHVKVKDQNGEEITVLQDGESTEVYAYDDRKVTVSEVPQDTEDD
jgi:hypothetical protein